MTDDRRREELAEAGYTGWRGAIIFCGGIAIFGAALGNVLFSVVFNMLLGLEQWEFNKILGTVFGAALFAMIGAVKVQQGNRAAVEAVEEANWRRELGPRRGRMGS